MTRKCFLLFIIVLGTSHANAQWWKFKRRPQPVILQPARYAGFDFRSTTTAPIPIDSCIVPRSQFSYDVEESTIMKTLYHSLRFHVTADILTGFNSLIRLYIEQNRYSEAKWYLLQCNAIARQQNDRPTLITSLISLGMLKADIGDYEQARGDLTEARSIAVANSMTTEVLEIDKKLNIIREKKNLNIKNEIHYAEIEEIKKR